MVAPFGDVNATLSVPSVTDQSDGYSKDTPSAERVKVFQFSVERELGVEDEVSFPCMGVRRIGGALGVMTGKAESVSPVGASSVNFPSGAILAISGLLWVLSVTDASRLG